MIAVEIQCLPTPAGTPENTHAYITAAITAIQESGMHYEIGPLGTSIEGEPDEIWPLLRRIHETTLTAGAASVISIIKVEEGKDRGLNDLTRDYR